MKKRCTAMGYDGEFSPGRIVGGKYLILRRIGSGGAGKVYEVKDLHLNKVWAMKWILCSGNGQQSAALELSRIRTFNHPGLPRIVDAFPTEGGNCIVMDFLEGITFDRILEKEQVKQFRVDKKELIRWGTELCEVLDYLHHLSPPVIYRDMKPGNILLKPDGKVMLLDFGTTKDAGTPGYASPEQMKNGRADERSDIYSLGRTLYRISRALGEEEKKRGSGQKKGIKAGVRDAAFLKILKKACEENPEKRFQSAVEMKRSLESLDSRLSAVKNGGWTKRSAVISCAAAISLTFMILMSVWLPGSRESQAADTAGREKQDTQAVDTAGQERGDSRSTDFGAQEDGDSKSAGESAGTAESEDTALKMAEHYRILAETCKEENPKEAFFDLKEACSCLAGKTYDKAKAYDEAIRVFRLMLDLPSDQVPDPDLEIREAFEKLRKLDPDRWELCLQYISWLYRNGDLEEAAGLFRGISDMDGIEEDPNYQRLKIKLQNAGAL